MAQQPAGLLEPAVLLRKAVKLIAGYDATVDTIDVYCGRALGDAPHPGTPEEGDWLFLQQAMYGTQRMDKALRVFLNALYHVKAASVSRADYNMYKLMAYLLFFRLRELGVKKLVPLLEGQDAAKMHTLLNFAMDREAFGHWVLEGWCSFLDRSYIEAEILSVLDDARAGLNAWLDKTHAQAWGGAGKGPGGGRKASSSGRAGGTGTGAGGSPSYDSAGSGGEAGDGSGEDREARRAAHVKAAWTPTVPVAPKLTQPKARMPPEPQRIPQGIKAAPVPDFLDAPEHTMEGLAAANEARKKAVAEGTKAKYSGPGAGPPPLHETRKTVDRIRAEVEAAREAAMQPTHGYRPPPVLATKGADVQYTVAAILREDATAKAKAVAEAQLLRDYEAGLRDSREYYAWQEEERAKDEAARLAAVADRKAEAEAAVEKLRQALETKLKGNQIVAKAVKAAAAAADEHLQAEREGITKLKAELAAAVRAAEFTAPNQSKASLISTKREVVKEVREARLDAEAAIAQAREAELAQRMEVIRQIRALERVPRPHVRLFDPTTVGKDPTLEAMSLVELRERLVLLKARRVEEEEDKRRNILRDKREQQEMLLAKVEAMKARREQATRRAAEAKAARLAEKVQTEEEKAAVREEAVLALSERLAARKAARAAELAELEAQATKAGKEAAFKAGTAYIMEGDRLGQVLSAGERAAYNRQGLLLRESYEDDVAEARRQKDRELKLARESAAELSADKARYLAVLDASKEEQAYRLASTAAKKDAFFRQTVEEQAILDARDALNLYSGSLREANADSARDGWGGPPRAAQWADKLTRRIARLPPGHPLSPNMTLKLAQTQTRQAGASTLTGRSM